MSSEQNLSESPAYQEYAPAPVSGPNPNGSSQDGPYQTAPGMGQSKSSRRRRRKRKNKLAAAAPTGDTAIQNGGQFNGDIQAAGQSYAAAAPQPQNSNGGMQQPGQGGG